MLKAMTNFEADSSHRITVILAGQRELASILQFSHFDALRARIRLSHTLVPMSLEVCTPVISDRDSGGKRTAA